MSNIEYYGIQYAAEGIIFHSCQLYHIKIILFEQTTLLFSFFYKLG